MYTCLGIQLKFIKADLQQLKVPQHILISNWVAGAAVILYIWLYLTLPTPPPANCLCFCANLWSNPKQFHHNTLADNYFVYWTNIRVVSHKFERATAATTITKQNRPRIYSRARTKTSTNVKMGCKRLKNTRASAKTVLFYQITDILYSRIEKIEQDIIYVYLFICSVNNIGPNSIFMANRVIYVFPRPTEAYHYLF